jgi:nitroreductase
MTRDFLDFINERRAIRSFTNETIPKEYLLAIAEAGRHSSTSVNSQSRKFTIVQNKSLIDQLAHAMSTVMQQPTYDFYSPDALILVSVPRHNNYGQIETALAVQNMWLAASALNLGTTWTDQIRNLSDEPAVREVFNQLEIPSNHICWTILPVGVPAEDPAPKERTEEINFID